MKIFGIGIDVIEVERIEEAMREFGDRFLDRIFTAEERDYCLNQKRPAIHFAARWAAKEAVSKAFGTGIGELLAWQDMEIGIFIHFGRETWQDKETDDEPAMENMKLFSPTSVDTDQ